LSGCSAAQTSAAQDSSSHAPYVARAQSGTQGQVRVSAAALSADESAGVYGSPLADKLIQPVWIQVENNDNVPYWLMFAGLDPNFFPASEAAEAMALRSSPSKLAELGRRFSELAFRNPVPPGGTVSGFVLTNLHEGVKLLQIDLFADRRSRSFSLLAPVPGLRTDYKESKVFDRDYVAQGGSLVNVTSDAEFTAALESLPCCATNEDGSRNGDPLNLVIIGGIEDAFPSLVRRGWSPTEVTWKGSVMRMMSSAMSRERYPYAPISNLYLFGRPQDIALQKARDNIHQRNHLRLWRSPMLYHGKPVWVGQVSRDIGSRLTIHSPTFTTHKIDPDVDEAARALMEDLVYSQGLRAIGLVKGVGAAPKSAPRENLTTDPYYTAGMRSVLLFDSTPTSLTQIEMLPWQPFERGFLKPAIEIKAGE
jgi:LssY C-terminus